MLNSRFYSGLADEMMGRLDRLGLFTKHATSIGHYHEEVLRESIRPLLSRRFTLRTGFAFANSVSVSKQGDIVLVDEYDPSPYFFRVGNLVVVHPRAVACVVEVKTHLSERSFRDAISNLSSFQRAVHSCDPSRKLTTLVFAFRGAHFTPATLHNWYRSIEIDDKIDYYPQAIYCLERGLLLFQPSKDSRPFGHFFVTGEDENRWKVKGLSIFLQTIRKSLELKGDMGSNPFEYALLEGLASSTQFFRFGTGLSETTG